ncbi:MAG TPA: phosphatase PAP2 family protein [Candidatus Paceibacterota bacterium]|nr:phosphatase PAP2 family protein [Candidatus Paceibacterota bacterium]
MIAAMSIFDRTSEQFLWLHHSPFLTIFFTWVTYLGDPRALAVLIASMAVILWRNRHHDYVFGFLTTLAGSILFTYLLKILVARQRPPLSVAGIDAPGFSFPSMHAACAMAVYGFLAYMILKLLHPPHHRAPWVAMITILIILIGFSRLYLGVHYPSDVIAGYFIGLFFVLLGAVVTKRLERHTTRARSRSIRQARSLRRR